MLASSLAQMSPPHTHINQDLERIFGDCASVSLDDFFAHTTSQVRLRSLSAQVLYALSLQLERALGRVAKGGQSDNVGFEWEDAAEAMSGSSVALRLAQYVSSAQVMLGSSTSFAIANDKGSACKLQLRNGYLATPSGAAAVCAPVVDWGMHSLAQGHFVIQPWVVYMWGFSYLVVLVGPPSVTQNSPGWCICICVCVH